MRNPRKYTQRYLYNRRKVYRRFSLTTWIIVANVVFFIIIFPIMLLKQDFVQYVALQPSSIFQGKNIWTIITHMFTHGSLAHLFVNMISLFFIGNFVERLIGRKRFVIFYFIAGLSAAVFFLFVSFLFNFQADVFAVGASGALFGLGGLLAILTPRLPVLVFFIIPMPMWLAMIFLMFGIWLVSSLINIPIGNIAHLGGLLTGVLYGLYLRTKYKQKTKMISMHFR